MALSYDLTGSENLAETSRYFRVVTWDPSIIPTNALRGAIATSITPSGIRVFKKIDDGCTTGWTEIGTGGGGGTLPEYTRVFGLGDWLLNGTMFEITVQHNLNDSTPLITIYDGVDQPAECEADILNSNQIKLRVPASPDLRFAGYVRVTGT